MERSHKALYSCSNHGRPTIKLRRIIINKEYSDPLIVCTFVVAILIVIMGILAPKETQQSQEMNVTIQYCTMWQIWYDSDKEYGWPDKNNSYEKWCVE